MYYIDIQILFAVFYTQAILKEIKTTTSTKRKKENLLLHDLGVSDSRETTVYIFCMYVVSNTFELLRRRRRNNKSRARTTVNFLKYIFFLSSATHEGYELYTSSLQTKWTQRYGIILSQSEAIGLNITTAFNVQNHHDNHLVPRYPLRIRN
jgi:hypothetical protein